MRALILTDTNTSDRGPITFIISKNPAHTNNKRSSWHLVKSWKELLEPKVKKKKERVGGN